MHKNKTHLTFSFITDSTFTLNCTSSAAMKTNVSTSSKIMNIHNDQVKTFNRSKYVYFVSFLQAPPSLKKIMSRETSCASFSGFKKTLANRAMIQNYQFTGSQRAAFSRRKHKHTHFSIISGNKSRLSKAFGYIKQSKIDFFIGESLKLSYGFDNSLKHRFFKNKSIYNWTNHNNLQRDQLEGKIQINRKFFKPIPNFLTLVENESYVQISRNCFFNSFGRSKLAIRHKRNMPTIC